MRILKLIATSNTQKLKERMGTSKTVSEYKRWQVLYIVSTYEVDADYLAETTGYSKAMIYYIVQRYNNSPSNNPESKPRGGRRRSYMSLSEEREFMNAMESKAMKGQILSFRDIQKAVESKLDRKVSDDFIWDLFKRNGWTKHSPRPHHPLKDINEQEDFKKNSKTIWLPLRMILNQH